MLGLAIALAISALMNLALLISQRTRGLILSAGRCLIRRLQAVRADPNTNSTFPGPPRDETAPPPPPTPPPPPPPPPPTPAIVWPSVRPTAPPPPPRQAPRNLVFGAKGIFETGKQFTAFEKNKPNYLSKHLKKLNQIIFQHNYLYFKTYYLVPPIKHQ